MTSTITFQLVNFQIANFQDLFKSDKLSIQTYDSNKNILYDEIVEIQYTQPKYLQNTDYYFNTDYYGGTSFYNPKPILSTYNFILELTINYVYMYNGQKTIYIYQKYQEISVNYIGLCNYINGQSLSLSYTYYTVSEQTKSVKIINLFNNILNGNSLKIDGNITSIESIRITDPNNPFNIYDLLNVTLPIKLNIFSQINFYNTADCLINNIMLNNINTNNPDAVIFMIQLTDPNNTIQSYIQTLNLCHLTNDFNNYWSFGFNIQYGVTWLGINLLVFDYDYNLYLSALSANNYMICSEITSNNATLYNILIVSDTNLVQPTINTIDITNYSFNLNEINKELLNILETNLLTNFLDSRIVDFNILLDYLVNYNIKTDNLYIMGKNNYIDIITQNLNCILIKVCILYPAENFTINSLVLYGKIFSNNGFCDIYHLEYIIDDNFTKKDLISDLLLIILKYFQVKIFFYNNLSDLNTIQSNDWNSSLIINPNYRFNKFILNKNNVGLKFSLDFNYNLKLKLELKIDYKILYFTTSSGITDTILKFSLGVFVFEIFKISVPNGNLITSDNLYYIVFESINETNEFINFITNGYFKRGTKTYFNIELSLNFKKNTDNFYVESIDTKDIIQFRLSNLDLNSGNIFTNNSIIIL